MRINRRGKCMEPSKLAARRVLVARGKRCGKLLTESEVADCSVRNAKRWPPTFPRNFKRIRYTSNSLWHPVHGVQPSTLSITDEKLCPTPQTPLLWLASLKLTGEISDPNRSAFPRGTAQISKLAQLSRITTDRYDPFRPFLWSCYRKFYHFPTSACKKLGL